MVIGGRDIVFDGPTKIEEVASVIAFVAKKWPNGVIHELESAMVPFKDSGPLLSRDCELFLYRDAGSFASWEEKGATDENSSCMIHVLVRPYGMTFVVDYHKRSEATRWIREIMDKIERSRR